MTSPQVIEHRTRVISAKADHWASLAATRVWLKVKDIMSGRVVTIEPTATSGDAARKMAEHGISCLVVLDGDEIKGILTDRDFLRLMGDQDSPSSKRTVAECMTTPVQCATPDQTIVEAGRITRSRGIRRLPVTDGGKLVGIITETDLTRAMVGSQTIQKAGEVMSANVATVPTDATVATAATVMSTRRISCVVVMEAGQPKGILTERDVIKKVTALELDPKTVPVTEIMTRDLLSVHPGTSVFCAGRMMDQMRIHRLLVTDDDRLVGIITQTDIFRAAQMRLQAEEEKGLELLDHSKTSVYMLDADGRTIYLNPAFMELLELDDPAEFIDRPFLPDRFWLDPRQRTSFMAQIQEGNVQVDDLQLRTAKGNPLYVCVVSAFLRDVHGRISGTQGSIHDVTAKTLAEQATVLACQRLEKANHELKQMQSQIIQSEKLASIGQLAAGVAHEMNTPIGFVAGNFEALHKYISCLTKMVAEYDELAAAVESAGVPSLQEKLGLSRKTRQVMKIDFILKDVESLFDESKEGIDRVTTIVRNLRDFSRADRAEKFEDYDINRGIDATLIVARNEIKYDAHVVQDLGPVPPIPCHAGQINQVLLNILVNAAQSIRSQGRAEGDKGTITVRTYATEQHVVCQITDDGPGITPENLKRMFEPFFTTKPAGKGTGLGLSVSYDIVVNKHGGQLLVESEPGQKTTFTIQLPKTREPAPKPNPVLVETPSNG
jgi:PAS domain S-box-containing protein